MPHSAAALGGAITQTGRWHCGSRTFTAATPSSRRFQAARRSQGSSCIVAAFSSGRNGSHDGSSAAKNYASTHGGTLSSVASRAVAAGLAAALAFSQPFAGVTGGAAIAGAALMHGMHDPL